MPIGSKAIKNILVVRNDRFGEFLLNVPALRALRETFIHAKITAVVSAYVRELAENIPFIDEVVVWGQNSHKLSEKIKFINLLRKKKIDLAIMLNPSKEFNIFTYLASIPIRVGYDRKWGFLLTHKIKDKKYLADKHELDYNLELVALAGAQTLNKNLYLEIENCNLSKFNLNFDDCLIAIHPWTSDSVKQWPVENFYALAKKIIKDLKRKVLIIGSSENYYISKAVFSNLGVDLIDLTGKTSLMELAAILKKCKLLVSADSGPVHLSCSVGTAAIVLFRNDMPGKTAKRWGPRGEGHVVIERCDLKQISPDEVLSRIKEKLEK